MELFRFPPDHGSVENVNRKKEPPGWWVYIENMSEEQNKTCLAYASYYMVNHLNVKGAEMEHENGSLQQLLHPASEALVAPEHRASATFL